MAGPALGSPWFDLGCMAGRGIFFRDPGIHGLLPGREAHFVRARVMGAGTNLFVVGAGDASGPLAGTAVSHRTPQLATPRAAPFRDWPRPEHSDDHDRLRDLHPADGPGRQPERDPLVSVRALQPRSLPSDLLGDCPDQSCL